MPPDGSAPPDAPSEAAAALARSPLGPFRHESFRDVWIANLASNFGGLIQNVGASWLMLTLTASPEMVALVQASSTLPIMLFSLAAGAASDNLDRRQVMIAAQVFMLAVAVGLTALAFFGLLSPWLLLACTFLVGCGQALNGPAWQSSVGDLVPREEIPAAITVNSAGFNLARAAGPALGGAIVGTAGAVAAFAVNALSSIPLIVVLMRWRPPPAPPRVLPPETLGLAMSAGLRYVAMSPNILAVLLRGAAFGVGAIAVLALLPLVVRDLVRGGPFTFGLLLGAFGAGAVMGALASARLRRAMSTEALVRWAFCGYAVGVAIVALSPAAALSMAGLVLAGACWVLALATFNATVQLSAPRWVVGRAVALYQVATFGGMAFGSWAWGVAAAQASTGTALLLSAVVLLGGAALGLRTALPRLEALNLDPLSRWREPSVAVGVEPRSGPIFVTIEYRIAQGDLVEFMTVMAERRRVRRRDGARHWALLRDLADPELWIERYDSPTWVEYVRQNQRVTQADAAIGERLRALHRGPEPPRVHRMIERQLGALPGWGSAPAPNAPPTNPILS
jgi:MFS family permease